MQQQWQHTGRQQCLLILGITDLDADNTVIRRAYLLQALRWHPDKLQQFGINNGVNNNISGDSISTDKTQEQSKAEVTTTTTDHERQFKLITNAYNYLMHTDYSSKEPFTVDVVMMELMIAHFSEGQLNLQLFRYAINYYKQIDTFARYLFRHNYMYLFERVRDCMYKMVDYQLIYFGLQLFNDDGYLSVHCSSRGFLQHFPDITMSGLVDCYDGDNLLQVDCYLPACSRLEAIIADKLDIFDEHNLDMSIVGIRDTDDCDNYHRLVKERLVREQMSGDEKVAILKRYCLDTSGVEHVAQSKINNILLHYKF